MAEEAIKALKSKRGIAKRSLTSYDNFLRRFDPSKDFPTLEKRYKEIEATREAFESHQSQLESLMDESDDLSNYRTEFEELYFETYTIATNLLSKQITNEAQLSTSSEHGSTISSPSQFPIPNPAAIESEDSPQITPPAPLVNLSTPPFVSPQITPPAPLINLSTSQSVPPQTASTAPLINLPTSQSASHQTNQSASHWNPSLPAISLPTFRGSVDKWLEFYDLFNSLVHEDNSIPPIRKLFYLKGCLAGEAAGVISSIELSAQNYLTAWNLLKERYDDRKFIRDSYVKSLIDIPPISKEFPTRSFLDQIQKNIRSLQALGEPVEHWNALLIVLLRDKFNNFLRERWEDYSNDVRNPTLNQMISFLNRRAQLESAKPQGAASKAQNSQDKSKSFNSQSNSRSQHAYMATTSRNQCLHCEGNHYLSMCTKFLAMNPSQRYEISKKGGWCTNCLRKGHRAAQCTSGNCRNCNQRHHTLLHFDKPNVGNSNVADTAVSSSASSASINLHAHVSSEAVLATALVDFINNQGKTKTCRVFLDAGSQAHFITESAAKFLNLELKSVNIAVSGLDDLSTTINHSTTAVIKSRHNKYQKTVEFLVIPRINTTMPSIPINPSLLEIPKNIPLADPEFFRPSTVDALIGVKLFYKLLSVGQIALKHHPNAVLQKTQLGWIVAGEIDNHSTAQNIVCHLSIRNSSSDLDLTRFWELEEIPANRVFSPEESACEEHYKLHTTRDDSGRYVVRLPFNHKIHKLGESYAPALRRLYSLEARFQKNHELKRDYSGFLAEYQELKHMSLSKDQEGTTSGFYLPHHAVFKHDSLTTKLRVVFDGSAKTSTGISLNDALMVGPKLQDDLFVTLTRYRSHVYAFTADVEKMYRQVRVHPDDAIYQKILFRESPQAPILMYILDTVTYGTASASYLAIRSLQQLVEDEGGPYPLASIAVKRDFYVDDLLTGASTLMEAERLRDELIHLLEKAGFHLRKWASNHPSLITNCPEHPDSTHLSLDLEATVKTLGIHWNSRNDTLFYSVNLSSSEPISKRTILSQIAKLFDPLGLLGPVIVYAKIIIQLCWKSGVTWDESVPLDIHNRWLSYRDQLPSLERLRFPRCLIIPEPLDIQLHGFCDASEKAYGACIYVRSTDQQGMVHIRLICSKSRVAPVSSVSLPRLELCGALLLSRLCATVRESLLFKINDIHLWSDSTITLHWINTSPHLLKTFVANRAAEIQRLTSACHWRHTLSQDNPADFVSRGQLPSEFLQNPIWSQGPSWLLLEAQAWPNGVLPPIDIPELKPLKPDQTVCMSLTVKNDCLLEKYSSMNKLQRVVAYIMRFIHNTRTKAPRKSSLLSAMELSEAHTLIMKLTQVSAFSKEINCLKRKDTIQEPSKLIPLTPYLDELGILRVGGRLNHAEIPEDQRHPILLPAQHHITRTIIREEHVRLMHAGPQGTLYSVRQTYWPLDARNVTRKIIHNCISCFRAKPRLADHSTGCLPKYRVSHSRPFLRTGVDYCGPLFIKERRFRNRNKIKVYVAIYVCLSTKAVHLEVVCDLTTEAFLASLKRLFARRGKSTEIYSDNATNFVGANRELQQLLNSEEYSSSLKQYLDSQHTAWHFIPPRAPHFGGIWEAAVRSFKHHLLRTVGDTLLTYDQLETYVLEIEAILNSRPLSPMSSDPNDFLPLTPGHFLTGGPLTSFPQVDFSDTPSNRLSAWQHAQKLKQHFWTRWYKEYLNNLIELRHQSKADNLQVGSLVLILEDNLPPLSWALGRIIATHPGEDGVVRVVTLKTKSGEYKRCTKKLCPLPLD